MADEWLTIQEAAELTHYHPEWLRDLVRDKKVEGRKYANLVWQVNRQSLLEYLDRAKGAEDKRRGPKKRRKEI